MGKRRMPDLPDTGRHYVEDTVRARLASPGLERFQPKAGGRGLRVALAVLAGALLVGAMLWLVR